VNNQGSIAHFETMNDAKLAGYTRPLTQTEAELLTSLSRSERLARYDAMYGSKPDPRSRAAAKRARKARRKNRR
jgi:hypothetical protein